MTQRVGQCVRYRATSNIIVSIAKPGSMHSHFDSFWVLPIAGLRAPLGAGEVVTTCKFTTIEIRVLIGGVYQKIYINWIKGLFTKSWKSTINQNLFIATQPYFRRAAPARGSVPGLPTLSCSQTSTTQPQRITQWNLHQHHIPYLWVCTPSHQIN